MKERAFDLEERLIIFAVDIIRMVELLPNSSAGNHIRNKIMRSGTSPAANYGEAQSAESRADFTHKLKIILKELRETRVWLLIIRPHSKSLLTADYADNADKYQNIYDQMVKHNYETREMRESSIFFITFS